MLTDGIVNYLITQIRSTSKLDEVPLIEKVVSSKKVKFTFSRNTIKHVIEFGIKEISEVVYLNFIDEVYRQDITFSEFEEAYNNLIENCDEFITDYDFNNAVNDICYSIQQSKLFRNSESANNADSLTRAVPF